MKFENIKIYVIFHSEKDYVNIKRNELHFPLYVGGNEEYDFEGFSDDIGDNISYKNPNFCELTGLYWMWKNSDADVLGLCHYRRYFIGKRHFFNDCNELLSKEQINDYLNEYDIILPKSSDVIYDSIYEHYELNHNINDLKLCGEVIKRLYPEYFSTFNKVLNDNEIYYYNMFIASKEIINEYSDWLFNILFELEKNIDISDYDDYQKRVFGFLAERLLKVWVIHNNLKIKEVAVDLIGTNYVLYRLLILSLKLKKKFHILK